MDRKSQLIKMLELQPDDVFLKYALAMELVSENKLNEAVAQLENILKDDPDYLAAYYQLAKLYESIEMNDKAISTYEKGMSLAEKCKDQKTYGELRSALEELTF